MKMGNEGVSSETTIAIVGTTAMVARVTVEPAVDENVEETTTQQGKVSDRKTFYMDTDTNSTPRATPSI